MISGARLDQLLSTTAMPAELEPAAEPEPEPNPDAMNDGEFENVVRRLVENARNLMDEQISGPVDKAWRYYNREVDQTPMGQLGAHPDTGVTVYEGSKAVLSECFDQVQTLIPEIYRALAGSEEAVVFKPKQAEDTAYADQANDYVRHLFWDRNDGEGLIKDGLLEWLVKFAAYRVWREQSHKEHVHVLDGVDETQLYALQQADEIEIEKAEPYQINLQVPQVQPDGSTVPVSQTVTLYRVTCRYFEPQGRTRVDLIPQDELLVDLEAQNLDEATVLGIDAERRASDLIAMEIDPEIVKRQAGKGLRRGSNSPEIRRRRGNVNSLNRVGRDQPDESLWWVRTVDARVMVDRDGDGIAEAWRIIALGDPLEIASAVEDPGSDTIVIGSPFPRPHRLIGEGVVETTMDLQEIGSALIRRTLDSFARSVHPRPAISGASETLDDDLDSWFGGPIHLGKDGKIDWLQVPFAGAAAMPLLDYFSQRRTLRTGISPAAQGLDPNALKGQTVEGAGAIVAAPQSRTEGFAREFASRIMRPLFQAILRITIAYQDRPEVIRLRNKFVQVDPRSWNADMDVAVEVGTGSRHERMAGLAAVIGKQEQLYAAKSPLFELKKYRQALADLVHEMGVKDDERYFPQLDDAKMKELDEKAKQDAEQQMQQAMQMQQAVEQAKHGAKAQAEIAVEQVKAQLENAAKERELAMESAFERQLMNLEQTWKARLLQIEASLEAQVAKAVGRGPGGAGNANIERRA